MLNKKLIIVRTTDVKRNFEYEIWDSEMMMTIAMIIITIIASAAADDDDDDHDV